MLCDKLVTRLVIDGGRCVGVETGDGEQYLAGTAVLSTIHVTQLRDMAPASAWPEEFHYGIDTYDLGVPGFGVYLCTSAPPEFATETVRSPRSRPGPWAGRKTSCSWVRTCGQAGSCPGCRGSWSPRRRWWIPAGPRPGCTPSKC